MKRQLKMILTLAAAVALPALALAQTPQTPKTPPATAKPSTTDTKSTSDAKASASADSAFIHTAAMGGMAEVELGKLGVANATSSDVKQFAQRMVDDHSKANDELKALAAQKSVKLPAEVDAKHKAAYDKLAKAKGAGFDAAFMSHMVSDHQADVCTLRAGIEERQGCRDEGVGGKNAPDTSGASEDGEGDSRQDREGHAVGPRHSLNPPGPCRGGREACGT